MHKNYIYYVVPQILSEIVTHYAPPQEAVRIMDEDQDMTFIDQ